jgi:hypothetical protein
MHLPASTPLYVKQPCAYINPVSTVELLCTTTLATVTTLPLCRACANQLNPAGADSQVPDQQHCYGWLAVVSNVDDGGVCPEC